MIVKNQDPRNILIVRTDRIGDVVLTLPMISVVRGCFPHSTISLLIRSYTYDLAYGQSHVDRVLRYDAEGRFRSFFAMLSEIRSQAFDTVVLSHPTFRLALLMALAGIPRRVGTGYRWYSFLFNRRVYEHRRVSIRHEAEYNLSLLKVLGCSWQTVPLPHLILTRESESMADTWYEMLGLRSDQQLVILHPGSGGSARDWKPANFAALAGILTSKGVTVLITGGPEERSLVDQVAAMADGAPKTFVNDGGLLPFAAFLKKADLFVSNSTGPLHLAAAVGTPVIAFYPPIRECSPTRWGPLTESKVIFEPDPVDCPLCKGGKCRGDVCMDLISVEDVAVAAEKFLTVKSLGRRTKVNA